MLWNAPTQAVQAVLTQDLGILEKKPFKTRVKINYFESLVIRGPSNISTAPSIL